MGEEPQDGSPAKQFFSPPTCSAPPMRAGLLSPTRSPPQGSRSLFPPRVTATAQKSSQARRPARLRDGGDAGGRPAGQQPVPPSPCPAVPRRRKSPRDGVGGDGGGLRTLLQKRKSCFSSSGERGRQDVGKAQRIRGSLQPHPQAEPTAAPSSPAPGGSQVPGRRWGGSAAARQVRVSPRRRRSPPFPPSSRNNWEFSNKTFLHWKSIGLRRPELFVGKGWILIIFSPAS